MSRTSSIGNRMTSLPWLGVITIDVAPEFGLGPLTLSWHGLTIAAGILLGGFVGGRYARAHDLDRDRLTTGILVMAFAGVVGARLFYLAVNEPGSLVRPDELVGTRGFAFYGAMLLGIPAVLLYLRRESHGIRYLDAMAYGFFPGMALGRVGDIINGEHYGPPTDAPWGFRHLSPKADVPSTTVAYHNGGFYEALFALAMVPLAIWLGRRLRRPGMLLWAVVAVYGAGRFVMFFFRSDSGSAFLGLEEAQLTSLALIAAAGVGALLSTRRPPGPVPGRA